MPSLADHERHQRHRDHLADLADGHLGADVVGIGADCGKEPALALEIVVEREAEEAGDQEQNGERAVLHQLQALDEGRLLGLGRGLGRGGRRGVRQREAVEAQDQGDQTGNAQDFQLAGLADEVEEGLEERGVAAAEVEIPAHQERGQQPADRAPEADRREQAGVFLAQGPEGQRVGQSDRGEVEAAIDQHQQEDRPEGRAVRRGDQEQAPEQVADRQHFLGGEVAVGELPHDERAEDRAQTAAGHDQADRLTSLIFSSARCGTSISAQTLQMAYSRNIITESLMRVAAFIGVLASAERVEATGPAWSSGRRSGFVLPRL